MDPIDMSRAPGPAFFEREAARLERLAADMRRIGAGTGPTGAELADAPRLERWRVRPLTARGLVGLCTGHPRLGDGPVHTTEIWVLDARTGWARTLSRFYRLGTPAPEETTHGG